MTSNTDKKKIKLKYSILESNYPKPQKNWTNTLQKILINKRFIVYCLYLADLGLLSFTDKNPKLIKKLKGGCNALMKNVAVFPNGVIFSKTLQKRNFWALYLIHTALHTYMHNTMYKLITSECGLYILLIRLILINFLFHKTFKCKLGKIFSSRTNMSAYASTVPAPV